MFQMFGGEEKDVSIEFENELVGVVFDRFGTDIPIIRTDENHFICHVKVAVSPHFLSWIMSFGKQARIVSPDDVAEEMVALAEEVVEIYRK
jgi:predicted DNA-binding transcriptional regulator YafY